MVGVGEGGGRRQERAGEGRADAPGPDSPPGLIFLARFSFIWLRWVSRPKPS